MTQHMRRISNSDSISSRFGPVSCYFCGRVFEGRGGWVIEPHHDPGLFRSRCKTACVGMPFVVPNEREER